MPQEQMPHFPAVEKLATKGFLAVETWNNKRAMINFKATIEVPMLGTMIESCGDTLDSRRITYAAKVAHVNRWSCETILHAKIQKDLITTTSIVHVRRKGSA